MNTKYILVQKYKPQNIAQKENDISNIQKSEIQINQDNKFEQINVKTELKQGNSKNIFVELEGNRQILHQEFKKYLADVIKNNSSDNIFRSELKFLIL